MKALHRPDLFTWSVFDPIHNIERNTLFWVRQEGNVVFDPLPATDHDQQHLRRLGGVSHIVLSNSNHILDTPALKARTGASVHAPLQEKHSFPVAVDHWVTHDNIPFAGLRALELKGSKTPGELAFLLDETTLFCGALLRAPTAGSLSMLAPDELSNPASAKESARMLAALPFLEAIFVAHGWPVFRDAAHRLNELVSDL